jgi:hypothetical protein
MFLFNQQACPEADHPFLSWQGGITLKVESVVNAMRCAAVLPPFYSDPMRISTKSLRAAGATMLAAAGLPDYVIMKAGRWRSLAFLKYVRLSSPIFDSTLDALSSLDTLSYASVCTLTPGVGDCNT